jgi:DNA helicase II / ATP-dependent DNA helicase PcrA
MAGKINESLNQVVNCIDIGMSFVIEAGAGSGKTWTLIESIKYILDERGVSLERMNQRVVCITYTKIAKSQIIERLDDNPLVLVLTIHEFLWLVIKNYQKELKSEIIKYNQTDKKKPVEDLEAKIQNTIIEYSLYGRKFEKGRITHEDVIEFSSTIFKNYPKLASIVANRFPFLFIDEYQDTELRTIELLLDNLLIRNKNRLVLGFFGDSMQKIYNGTIGSIPPKYFEQGLLKLITKTENYRCSKKVINLLAKIRPSLIQSPTGKNLEGEVTFINCNSNIANITENYSTTLNFLQTKKGWVIDTNTKILLLTHKGIANKLGYENLLEVYDKLTFGRDRLLNKEELFGSVILNTVENLVALYESKNYRAFIEQLGHKGFELNYHDDKNKIRLLMNTLIEIRQKNSVKDVLDFIFQNLVNKPLRIDEFEIEISKEELNDNLANRKTFYDNLMTVRYSEFILIHEYIENYTPYSTKHGVKGDEYENVLIVIDDNSWNQYKFNDVFANNRKNLSRFDKTLNLLYVCCSRAKNNLVLLSLSEMDTIALKTIKEWFSVENVHDILEMKNS